MDNIDSSAFFNLGSSLMQETDPEFTVDVFIEIAKNSHIKYEYDKDRKALICDRILHTPFKYQFNYGFIPNTLSEDNDPIDVVVIMEDELIPGSYINCKLLGYLETKDDSGVDPKLIMCPSKKVDPTYSSYRNVFDINTSAREKIKYFFSHYKDLEHKTVEIGTFKNKHDAIEVYEASIKRFNSQTITPITSSTDISLTYSVSLSSINDTENGLLKNTSTLQKSERIITADNIITSDRIITAEPKTIITEPLIKKNDTSGYGCCGCLQTSD
jgi:inorganic pyrophosphatase